MERHCRGQLPRPSPMGAGLEGWRGSQGPPVPRKDGGTGAGTGTARRWTVGLLLFVTFCFRICNHL